MEALLIHCLFIYWLFHVLTRSDLLATPRAWFLLVMPKWVGYVATCAFCFTFHTAWIYMVLQMVLTGWLVFQPLYLFAAPVINMVLDLVVRALIRINEPPVMPELKQTEITNQKRSGGFSG